MASGDRHVNYVAINNTFMGMMLLVCAATVFLANQGLVSSRIVLLVLLGLLVSILAIKLPVLERWPKMKTWIE